MFYNQILQNESSVIYMHLLSASEAKKYNVHNINNEIIACNILDNFLLLHFYLY